MSLHENCKIAAGENRSRFSHWPALKEILVPVIVITVVSTIVVMVGTGRVSQAVIRAKKRRES